MRTRKHQLTKQKTGLSELQTRQALAAQREARIIGIETALSALIAVTPGAQRKTAQQMADALIRHAQQQADCSKGFAEAVSAQVASFFGKI